MDSLETKVEYIHHSGFTVSTKKHYLIFDYYKGSIDFEDKDTIVFSTHGHHDHYNPKIMNWLDINEHILYVLSSDIDVDPSTHVYIMDPDESLKLFDVEIESFGSTDLGLSFLIKVDGITIFFAGDLNWWYWEEDNDEEKQSMEKNFKAEISMLNGKNIDIAFFPVDPRLEENYSLGGEYFIKKVKPKVFFPMHFGDNFKTTKNFIHKIGDSSTQVVEISKNNQIFHL